MKIKKIHKMTQNYPKLFKTELHKRSQTLDQKINKLQIRILIMSFNKYKSANEDL